VKSVLGTQNYRKVKTAILQNVLWQLIPILAALVSVPYTISVFGKELFSIYALAVAYIVGLNYLHMGVATNVNRDLAATEETNKVAQAEIFWTGLLAMGAISLVIMLIFLLPINEYVGHLTAEFSDKSTDIEQFFRLVVYQSPIVMLLIYLRAVLESRVRFSITASNRALLNTALLGTPVFATALDFSFQAIPILFLIFHLISTCYLIFNCWNYFKLPFPIFRLNKFISMLKTGGSLTFMSLAVLVFLYFDRYVLSSQGDLEEVAYFLAPFDVLARISFIYGSIGAVFFPVFSKLYSRGDDLQFMKMYDVSYWLIFSILGFISYIVISFSGDLLGLWLGADFRDKSASIMNILVIGILFTGLSTIPSRALIALRQESLLGYAYLGAGILYMGFSFILIKKNGAVGAAYAFFARSIIELAFLNWLLSYKSRRLMRANLYRLTKAFKYFSAPFALFFALLVVDLSLAIRIFILLISSIFFIVYVRHTRLISQV